LTNFIHSFPEPWNQFAKFLKDKPFLIREEALLYVPKTGYFFSESFVCLLKEGSGSCFSILPLSFREEIIGICTLSSQDSVEGLKGFLQRVKKITIDNEAPLNAGNLNLLLRAFKERLWARCPLWVNRLADLANLLEDSIKTFNENKFQDFSEVLPITAGDRACLLDYVNQAVKLPQASPAEEKTQL